MANISKDILAGWFFACWIIDTAATVSFVQQFGVEAELNPMLRSLIITYGLAGFVLVKSIIPVFWIPLYRHAHVTVNAGLAAIMLPIAYMGMQMAWG